MDKLYRFLIASLNSWISVVLIVAYCNLFAIPVFAADTVVKPANFGLPHQELILGHAKTYPEAMTLLNEAAKELKIPIDLRGLIEDSEEDLKYSKADPEFGDSYSSRFLYHPDGVYLSVEYNVNEYHGKGAFYVVAASAEGKKPFVASTLKKAKNHFPSAYIRDYPVMADCPY